MITYATAKSTTNFNQILSIQKANLKSNVNVEEYIKEGFVTLEHDIKLLSELNTPYPHIIALHNSKVVGYALVTIPEKVASVPLLQSTISELIDIKYKRKKVLDLRYFIMGQICIDKNYRGQGIFQGLYKKMEQKMNSNFDIIITEIATENKRSMRAHEKVGFEVLKIHMEQESEWAIVGLNLKK